MGADRRRSLGASGEEAAARWYAEAGHVVLERNWRCRGGEIDLITRAPDGTLVICEVKTRSTEAFGSPFESVTAAKQRRLRRLAAQWLAQPRPAGAGHAGMPRGPAAVRFDVAAVRVGPGRSLHVEVLESAF